MSTSLPERGKLETTPLVSVILPVYNGEAHIRQTLESVLAQSYRNVEVIVVDDGSTDSTAECVEALAATDSRLRLVRQPNGGVARARNRAISEANGEFIAPLDADDLWDPTKIERQVRRMLKAGPDTGMVYCWWMWIDADGSVLDRSPRWRVEGRQFEMSFQVNFTGNASVPLYRRSCVQEVGEYAEQLAHRDATGCEDWDLALRVAARYQVAVVPALLVGYRRRSDSMSTSCDRM